MSEPLLGEADGFSPSPAPGPSGPSGATPSRTAAEAGDGTGSSLTGPVRLAGANLTGAQPG
ncbi:MAG TPA: hypothetical protein VFN61_12790, partial [Acidimicrobiales bacterium]|nr:hypothetical protein [Acidimicrobiales bacterium]